MKQFKEDAIQIVELGKTPHLAASKIVLMNTDRLPDDLIVEVGKFLSPKELKKASRLRKLKDRRTYIAERGILRKLAGEVIGVPPADFKIGEGIYGKPFLSGFEKTLPLNISNCGSLVAIAFDFSKREVGIDVEKIDLSYDYSEIAFHYFSEKEWEKTNSHRDFYRFWTMKESLLKVTGVGLVDDLRKIDLSAKQNRVKVEDERLLPFKNTAFTLFTLEDETMMITLAVAGAQMSESDSAEVTVTNVYFY